MKGAVIAVIIGLVSAAFYATWKTADAHGYDRAMLELAQIQLEADQAWRKAMADKARKLNQLQTDLKTALDARQVEYRTIEKKVVEYVQADDNCNLTHGAVRLHDEAWGQHVPGMPGNSALPDAEAGEASPISQRDLIRKDIEYAGWCLEIESRFDALVVAVQLNSRQQAE